MQKYSFIPKVLRSEDLLQAIFFGTECIAIFYHFLCSVNHLFLILCLDCICSAMGFIVLSDISTDYYSKVVQDFHGKDIFGSELADIDIYRTRII